MASRERGSVSKWWLVPVAFLTGLLVFFVALINSDIYADMKAMMSTKAPKYELGERRGAAYCGTCHSNIYRQSRAHSRHAVATTNENFLSTRDYVEGNVFLGTMMGEESCYACHGVKGSADGVDCEICHGPATPELSITELHKTKYKPGLSAMKEKDFCAKCHELFPPLMSPYSQWLESKAAEEGLTCQGCHMAPVDGIADHGFDSIMHNPGIYEGDLVVRDINLSFPNISMTVVNRIKGHGIPSGGPSRVLVLEISILGDNSKELHKVVDTFYRKFELSPEILGSMPSAVVIEDTTLKSLEARAMSYELPAEVEGEMRKASIKLSFYDVADQYQGNIEKAHWISGPLFMAELELH